MLFSQVWAPLVFGTLLLALVGLIQLSLAWVRHRRFYKDLVSPLI
jgi:hypothetical protein